MKKPLESLILWIAAIAALGVSLVVCGFMIINPFPLAILSIHGDHNPPVAEMNEYYSAHQQDFEKAVEVLLNPPCDSYLCDAPDDVSKWAGADAQLFICDGNEAPPLYELITKGGAFTYIPNQESVPQAWRPCVGVFARCSDKIADEWFRCHHELD